MRLSSYIGMGVLALAVIGCSSDDDPKCPDAAVIGEPIACECPDGSTGTQECRADNTLSDCDCGEGGNDGGAAGEGGQGGRGGRGASDGGSGSGGSRAGSGGSGPVDPGDEEDAGAEPTPTAGQGGGDAPTLPMDGNQGAVCENDRDCNMGLGCYGAESDAGRGFCTRSCEAEEDCMDIAGATYTCGGSDLCIVECEGEDDAMSCPAGMQCFGAGGGGSGNSGRCLYADEDTTPEPQGAFEPCGDGNGQCADGLQCIGGGGPMNSGFCSRQCTPENADCSDLMAASGEAEATCQPQGPMVGICALDCAEDADACPEGMECMEQGFYQRCVYP